MSPPEPAYRVLGATLANVLVSCNLVCVAFFRDRSLSTEMPGATYRAMNVFYHLDVIASVSKRKISWVYFL